MLFIIPCLFQGCRDGIPAKMKENLWVIGIILGILLILEVISCLTLPYLTYKGGGAECFE